MERSYPWGEPRDDDFDQEFEPGIDGCHHGVGFDEDCEYCDDEDRAERLKEREKRKRQKNLPFDGTEHG